MSATIKAAAEGYTLGAVISALRTCEAEANASATEKALAAMAAPFVPFKVGDLTVFQALTGTRYRGGYHYAGTVTSPSQFQAQAWASSSHEEADEAGALEWMNEAPTGALVRSEYHSDESEFSIYEKTSEGWFCVDGSRDDLLPSDDDRPWLCTGIRQAVADRLGVGMSAHFHELFNEAVTRL